MSEKIFISYSRIDEDIVLPFKDEIEQQTYKGSCWIDYDGIETEAQFVNVIINAIKRTDIFLFMQSANSIQSQWTRKEINFADGENKKIVIVSIDDSKPDDYIKFQYGLCNHANLQNPRSKAKLLYDLKSWICHADSKPENPVQPLPTDEFVSNPKQEYHADVKSESPVQPLPKDELVSNHKWEYHADVKSESPVQLNSKDETITVKGVAFKMIHVEGCSSGDFYIGETQVTLELWEAVMGTNPSEFKGSQNPVGKVSWKDCQKFISKLNELTGKRFRLPTEAEWEYAAKGGNKSQGYIYSGSNNIDEVAWYRGTSGGKIHAVKTKSPNELGIYDMSGNVWEWCNDRCFFFFRVCRGGSWDFNASYCRVSNRGWNDPSIRGYNLGLRLAL